MLIGTIRRDKIFESPHGMFYRVMYGYGKCSAASVVIILLGGRRFRLVDTHDIQIRSLLTSHWSLVVTLISNYNITVYTM